MLALISGCQDNTKTLQSDIKEAVFKAEPIAPDDLNVTPIERVTSAHIRGLHLLNDQTGWASGVGGTVLHMTNGVQWEVIEVPGYAHLDFRDIYGFDALTALAMAAGEEGRLIRTEDGGKTWTEVYTNLEEGIFLDGIDFEGKIVFLEDVEEKTYRVDKMVYHLLTGTNLKKAAGIILGACDECNVGEAPTLSLNVALDDLLRPLGIPVSYGLAFGHIKRMLTIPTGIRAAMDADKNSFELLEAAVI